MQHHDGSYYVQSLNKRGSRNYKSDYIVLPEGDQEAGIGKFLKNKMTTDTQRTELRCFKAVQVNSPPPPI